MIRNGCYWDSKLTRHQGRILRPGLLLWHHWGRDPILRRNTAFPSSVLIGTLPSDARSLPRGAC